MYNFNNYDTDFDDIAKYLKNPSVSPDSKEYNFLFKYFNALRDIREPHDSTNTMNFLLKGAHRKAKQHREELYGINDGIDDVGKVGKFGKLKDVFKNLNTSHNKELVTNAGIASLSALNANGLFNDKHVLGQLLGGAGGAIASHFLPISTTGKIAVGLGGGALGSLFDNLRTRRDKKLEKQKENDYAI